MGRKALVVDDDEMILYLLECMLAKSNYNIVRAIDGDMAAALLETGHFDLVITDLQMGQTSGLDVIRKTKNINPGTIAIMITGCCDPSCEMEAYRYGADDFLHKPFSLGSLLSRIQLQEVKQSHLRPTPWLSEQCAENVSG
jgi:DNA-binding response OmpR family regulator